MKFQVNETGIKVALIAFNFIFSILSVALIALGVVYVDDLALPKKYVGLDFLELPTLLVVLGSLSFVASLAGCYIARCDSQLFTKLFIAFLSVLLALEITIAAISFYNMSEDLETKIRHTMKTQLTSDDPSEVSDFHKLEAHVSGTR